MPFYERHRDWVDASRGEKLEEDCDEEKGPVGPFLHTF